MIVIDGDLLDEFPDEAFVELGDIVTADNITYTRFSRNKRISRVMTEFEWVRELNEGVKKIYSDMADAGLPAPEYIEGPNTVRLILRNNIDERMPHRNIASDNPSGEGLNSALPENVWEHLDDLEKDIVQFVLKKGAATRAEIENEIGKSTRTVSRRLKKLTEDGILSPIGGTHDPNRQYKIK